MADVENDQSILSKEIMVDESLQLSNSKNDFKKIIADSIESIATPEQKLDKLQSFIDRPISFPNNYVLATISSRVYEVEELCKHASNHDRVVYPGIDNWRLLTVGHDPRMLSVNGYCGAAYWNPETQQVIIAHCGTTFKKMGSLYSDVFGIFMNDHVPQIDSAVTFTEEVISVLREINEQKGSNIQLYFTGHSLGAWLACITAFSAKFLRRNVHGCFVSNLHPEDKGYHSSAVIFDGPGCQEMLERIQNRVMDRYGTSLIASLDIRNYLSAPHLINVCNHQVGDVYRLFINLTEEDRNRLRGWRNDVIETAHIINLTLTLHEIERIKATFNPETGHVLEDNGNLRIKRVKDWPQLLPSVQERNAEPQSIIVQILAKLTETAFQCVKFVAFPDTLKIISKVYDSATYCNDLVHELKCFLSTANESNNYEPQPVFNSEVIGRKIRYETEDLNIDYKNAHKQTALNACELKFLEQYKVLEKYEQDMLSLFDLNEVFDSFKDKNLQRNVKEMLRHCKIDNGVIESTEVQRKIIFIKSILHLFPKINEKVKEYYVLLPEHIPKKYYQGLSETYLGFFNKKFGKTLDFVGDTLGLKAFLMDESKNVLHLTKSCTSIEVEKTHKTFKIVCRDYSAYEEQALFLNFERILGDTVFINYLKKVASKCLLCVECRETLHDETAESFVSDLLETVQESPRGTECLKLILITKKESDISNFVRNYFSQHMSSYQEDDNEVLFENLTKESQEKLLKKEVLFYGRNVPFSEVVKGCTSLKSIMNSETISALSQNKLIRIETALPDVEHYYVDRQLVQNAKVREDILWDKGLSPKKTKIAISNLSERDVSTLMEITKGYKKKFSVLAKGNEESDFKRICSNCENVHWLEKKNGDYIWKKSHGKSLVMLRKYLENYECTLDEEAYSDRNSVKLVDFNDVNRFQERLIIIAAEPGMGKTTAFTRLGMMWLKNNTKDSQWLIRVNLEQHKQQLKEEKFKNALDIIDFFFDKNTSELAKQILKSRLTESGEVLFLIDGFDEISSKSQKEIIKLLKLLLRHTKVKRVFISTRLHLRKKLENEFSTIAYTFKPFFRKDQTEFLQKFWKEDFNLDRDERYQRTLIDTVLDFIPKSIDDVTAQLMGIPLQMRMVAEYFRDSVRNDTLVDDLSTRSFNVFKLYNHFINAKFREFLRKIRLESIDLNDNIEDNWITSVLTKAHQNLAFKVIFPNDMKRMIGVKNISDDVKQQINIIGIVQIINDEPIFIHKTFAEYYVASIMAHRLSKYKVYISNKKEFTKTDISKYESKYTQMVKFLGKELPAEKNRVIRIFLDYRLSKDDDLLSAIFEGKRNDYEKILSSDPQRINKKDALGRDANYYLFRYGNINKLQNDENKHDDPVKPSSSKTSHSDQTSCSKKSLPKNKDMGPPLKKRKTAQ